MKLVIHLTRRMTGVRMDRRSLCNLGMRVGFLFDVKEQLN